MKYFKHLTSTTSHQSLTNAVVMGRKTWESIPEQFRPLQGRLNIILTRNVDQLPPTLADAVAKTKARNTSSLAGEVRVASSLDAALDLLSSDSTMIREIEHVFVIGGGQVYNDAIVHPGLEAVHLTKIDADYACDTFFPDLSQHPTLRVWSASAPRREPLHLREPSSSSKRAPVSDARYHFLVYTHNHRDDRTDASESATTAAGGGFQVVLPRGTASAHEEQQYLDLIKEVIEQGVERGDRTGTGTLSVFGRSMSFNLRHSFPLLTTKRVFWRGLAEELLWFVAGETDANKLADKGVHIWDGNGSREFLDGLGLTVRHHTRIDMNYRFLHHDGSFFVSS